MSNSDTWPGGVAMESLSNMDSAGSCDSVISVNSGFSEDSMEHLSAEERACLMYLEEMIESLEMQEDSGLSNDEPDPAIYRLNPGVSSLPAAKPKDPEMLLAQLRPPVTAATSTKPKPDTQTDILSDGDPESTPTDTELCPNQSSQPSSGLHLEFIPPPTGFRDNPENKKNELHPPPAVAPNKKPPTSVNLELMRQRASEKRPHVSCSVTPDSPNKLPSEMAPIFPISPPPDGLEQRNPPTVFPKPKKLPSNIILKSHKTPVGGGDATTGYSTPSSADHLLMDPQKVHMEALRKLGLLKSEEVDQGGPALSPGHSPKSRSSWASPTTPLSPLAPNTPTPPLTPPCLHQGSALPTSASVSPPAPVTASPSASSKPPAVPHSILPAPAAFSDPVGPVTSHDHHTDTAAVVSPAALTPLHGLDDSVLGQEFGGGGDEVDANCSLIELHNSWSRPASLGNGREFSTDEGEGSEVSATNGKDLDSRIHLSPYAVSYHSNISTKLPRSQGTSVLICPRSQNEEDRRMALKKLGLLRD